MQRRMSLSLSWQGLPSTCSHVSLMPLFELAEKITEVHFAEMAEIFKRVTGAAYGHVFRHQLCADRHNADGNGFLTHLQLTPRLTLPALFCFCSLLRGTQRPSTMCPTAGAQALTVSSLMTWYPCLSVPALHCRVPFSPLCFFSPKAEGTGMSLFFT